MERYEQLRKAAQSKQLSKSTANLLALIESTNMSLPELLELLPPEVVLCHLSEFLKMLKSKAGLTLTLSQLWLTFASYLMAAKGQEEVLKISVAAGKDKLKKVLIRAVPGLIVNETFKDIKDISKLINDIEFSTEQLSYFALIWRSSNYSTQYTSDIIKKCCTNMNGMKLFIDSLLDDIIRKCRFNKIVGSSGEYQQNFSEILNKNDTLNAILEQVAKSGNQSVIIQQFGEYLFNLSQQVNPDVAFLDCMKCLILITANNPHMSETFQDVTFNCIRRLLIQAMFRYDFNLLLPLFKHYERIKSCITKPNEQKFNILTIQIMLSIVVIQSMNITPTLMSNHSQAVKEFIIMTLKESQNVKLPQYLQRPWPQQEISQIFSSKNKRNPNDEEALIKILHEDIKNLGKQCAAFKFESVFLILYHLKHIISQMKQLPEPLNYPLFLSINSCLTQFRRYLNNSRSDNLNNWHLFQATTVLCSWLSKHCHDEQLPQLINSLDVLKQGKPQDIYSELQTYILQQIQLKQFRFSCLSIYWLKKTSACAKSKRKCPIPAVKSRPNEFSLAGWLQSLSKMKLKTSFSFFQIFNPSLDDVEIACLSIALILVCIAQQKKPVKDIINSVFSDYIFKSQIQLNFKIAFLLVPETISLWNIKNHAIRQAYDCLDSKSLSLAYESIGCWKGAIRYMDTTVNIDNIRNAYIYECHMDETYSAIPFGVICAEFGLKAQNVSVYETQLQIFLKISEIFRKSIYILRRDKTLKPNRIVYNRQRWLCNKISSLFHQEQIRTFFRLLRYTECMRAIVGICTQQVTGTTELDSDDRQKQTSSAAGDLRLRQIMTNLYRIIWMRIHPTARSTIIYALLDVLNNQIYHMFNYVKQVRQRVERFNSQAILSLIDADEPVESLHLSYMLKPLDKIRIHFRLSDYINVQSLCQKQLESRVADQRMEGSEGWLQLIYYHIRCKVSLSILQFDMKSTIRWILKVKHFGMQTIFLSSILYEFMSLNINASDMEDLISFVGKWLDNSSKDKQGSEKLLFSFVRFVLHKVTIMDLSSQQYSILDICTRNLNAVGDSVIELLIAKINDKKDYINSFVCRLLEQIAIRFPNESIWWVSRLAHFCDYSGDVNKTLQIQKSLFTVVDIEKYTLGCKIMGKISNQVDNNTICLIDILYDKLEMRFKKELMDPKRVKQTATEENKKWKTYPTPANKTTSGVVMPFQRPIIIQKIDNNSVQGASKCLTKFINITYRRDGDKSLYSGTILLKGQFKASNRGLEVSAGQLFASIIDSSLGITYCIVPLSKYSVLIQFVDGFHDVRKIIDEEPRSKPQLDINSQIQKEIDSEKGKNPSFFQAIYHKFHKKVQPVLYRFLDDHQSLDSWWNARHNYIRTTAIWSIIGYIFGLGDRHNGNIMLNCRTGKVIHVDYEYLLDTGKNLPRPEYVPFRMTKNIESPMGILGAYGTFYVEAIKEMQRLQKLESTILDSLSLFKISNSSSQQDKLSEMVLSRLKPKESLDKNVYKLIQTSKNDDLLSRMYYGWNSLQ